MELDRRAFLAGIPGLALSFRPNRPSDRSLVTTRQGTVRGRIVGDQVVFLGIPFAQPPVGNLRFRAPQPPLPWRGVRDAVKNAPNSLQGGGGSEDSLYLNVWTPSKPGPHPVLVWIHGGGNAGGGTDGQSGVGFAQEGIVVVTVAYRLSVAGYIELGHLLGTDYDQSGINGIRDLEAALRWVRENIEAFGGDPDQVTIAGHSAGAKNVAALLAAPSAQGLFHRAISVSGSGMTVHPRAESQGIAGQLLEGMGFAGAPERLLTATPDELRAGARYLEANYRAAYPFRPMVGGAYLPDLPVNLVRGRVPLLLGTCREESVSFLNDDDIGKPIRSREVANVPHSVIPEMETRYRDALPDVSDLERRVRLVTAEEYWIPSVRLAEAHAARGGETWMYRFDHRDHPIKTPKDPFIGHGADYAYLWERKPGFTLHETYVDFIRGKSPNWPQYSTFERNVMLYGQDGQTDLAQDPRHEERILWNGVI